MKKALSAAAILLSGIVCISAVPYLKLPIEAMHRSFSAYLTGADSSFAAEPLGAEHPAPPVFFNSLYHDLSTGDFSQNWNNTSLITTNDDWSGVPSIIGYLGDNLSASTATDPQTVLLPGTTVDVIAQSTIGNNEGGVHEIELPIQTIALQGSATADAPHIVIHLNTTGRQDIQISYRLIELDQTTANQRLAIQYRIGEIGDFVNIPNSATCNGAVSNLFNADSSQAINVSCVLPSEINDKAQVQVRIITNDTAGSDAMIGIENILVTSTAASSSEPAITTSPSSVAFGDQTVGTTSAAEEITIGNDEGTAVLNWLAAIEGMDAAQFAIVGDTSGSVAAGENTSPAFSVTFTPTSTGEKSASLLITSDDPENPTVSIPLTGNGTPAAAQPEIDIRGNDIADPSIPNGDMAPSVAKKTDFGSRLVTGTTFSQIFTIHNLGTADLNLTGTPRVAISGANAADFEVTMQPALGTIGPAAATVFTIRFDPSDLGLRTAVVSIANDDADENPYTFAIQGTGVEAGEFSLNSDEFAVTEGDGTVQFTVNRSGGSFGAVSVSYILSNAFNANGAAACGPNIDFINTGATLEFADGETSKQVNIEICDDDDPEGGTESFVIFLQNPTGGTTLGSPSTATVTIIDDDGEPDMNVSTQAASVADGDTTPSIAENSEFGSVSIHGGSVTQSWTITNLGTIDLVLNGTPAVQITGPNADDFTVTLQPSTTLSNGEQTTFEVTFDPSETGLRSATIVIPNNDPDEDPYDFAIQGTGTGTTNPTGEGAADPSIVSSGEATLLTVAVLPGEDPVSTDITVSADLSAIGGSASQQFFDDGTNGDAAAGDNVFSFTATIGAGVMPGPKALSATIEDAQDRLGGATVNLNVVPAVVINEIDSDNPGLDTLEFIELYDGGVGSTPLDGLVVVFFNGSDDLSYRAIDLDGFSTNPDGYFTLGNAAVPGVGVTFANSGLQNGPDAVAIYFGNASDFPNGTEVTRTNLHDAVVYEADDIVDIGLLALLNFGQLQVNENGGGNAAEHSIGRCPNGSGGRRNTDTFTTLTPSPNSANACAVGEPEMSVENSNEEIIEDGDDTPSTSSQTDFGRVGINGGTAVEMYTIRNTGTTDLELTGTPKVSVTGPNADDFTVTMEPTSPIAPGGSTTFQITFDPSATGLRQATISIANNDSDENPYDFAIQGTGATPDISVEDPDGNVLTDNTGTVDLGTEAVGVPGSAKTFTVRNVGFDTLNVDVNIAVTGANASDFVVDNTGMSPVLSPSGVTAFTVTFTPSGAGQRTAQLQISSDDPDEAVFEVNLSGTGEAGAAEPIVVNSLADNTTADGLCTLREAIIAANTNVGGDCIAGSPDAPDRITFDAGLFNPLVQNATAEAQVIVLGGTHLSITGDLTIEGPGADMLTISGNGQSRVFLIGEDVEVTLQGLTIADGNPGASPQSGGGILSFGDLTLIECMVRDNSAGGSGGGIRTSLGTSLTIERSTIANNSAGSLISGVPVDSLIGGGIDTGGQLTLTNSTVSGNLSNSLANGGGGVFAGGETLILNSTITNNRVVGSGASGVFHPNNGSSATVGSSIIAGNVNPTTLADVFGAFTSVGFNLIGNVGTATGFTAPDDQTGTGAAPINPLLGPLQNNGGPTPTHAFDLSLGLSPAIDRGSAFGLTTDQRGMNRTVDFGSIANSGGGDGTDVGAYELLAPTAAPASISGRVMTAAGTGIRSAVVTVQSLDGQTRSILTGPTGHFRIDGLATGASYIVSVSARRYTFPNGTRIVNLEDNIDGLDFTAGP